MVRCPIFRVPLPNSPRPRPVASCGGMLSWNSCVIESDCKCLIDAILAPSLMPARAGAHIVETIRCKASFTYLLLLLGVIATGPSSKVGVFNYFFCGEILCASFALLSVDFSRMEVG